MKIKDMTLTQLMEVKKACEDQLNVRVRLNPGAYGYYSQQKIMSVLSHADHYISYYLNSIECEYENI